MKKALLNSLEPGRVCDVVDLGNEFEAAASFQWVDCPDDTLTSHTYNESSGEFIAFDPLTQSGFAENAYKVARAVAYTGIGDQLDMLYKEISANGTISATGPWASHITAVKTQIPKDDPAAVLTYIRNNSPT